VPAVDDHLSRLFSALADPTRRQILSRLSRGSTTVGTIAEPLNMTGPAVSQHLKVLERAGLVAREPRAQWRIISLRREPLDEVAEWIDAHRRNDSISWKSGSNNATPRIRVAAPTDDAGAEPAQFTLTRRVDAPRETVWELWTDPEELTFWFHPRGASAPRELISVDLQVGGRYRYAVIDDRNGDATVFGGAYVDIREPERLVFTWGHPDHPVDEAAVVTVTLTAVGERTELTLHVRGLRGRPGEGGAYDGWDQALDMLVDRLSC
jgi:uncharacterized protein YndB with AHSA1/START domain/DNA-binding transcriptional ArsR family regulator